MADNITEAKAMAIDIPHLMKMTQEDLDKLFSASPSGEIPDGDGDGTAIVAPGTKLERPIAKIIRYIAWQGKVIDKSAGELVNKILPMGVHAVVAKVFKDKSWYDGKPCIVLDYSKTSVLAQKVRDEIRLVSPGIYLGIVYWGRTKTINFTLKFPKDTSVAQ